MIFNEDKWAIVNCYCDIGLCRSHAGGQDFKRSFVQCVSALPRLSTVPCTRVAWQSVLRSSTRCDDRIWLFTETDDRQESMHSFTSTRAAYTHWTHAEFGGSLSACSLAVDMLLYNCRVKPCWVHKSRQVHNQHWVLHVWSKAMVTSHRMFYIYIYI